MLCRAAAVTLAEKARKLREYTAASSVFVIIVLSKALPTLEQEALQAFNTLYE